MDTSEEYDHRMSQEPLSLLESGFISQTSSKPFQDRNQLMIYQTKQDEAILPDFKKILYESPLQKLETVLKNVIHSQNDTQKEIQDISASIWCIRKELKATRDIWQTILERQNLSKGPTNILQKTEGINSAKTPVEDHCDSEDDLLSYDDGEDAGKTEEDYVCSTNAVHVDDLESTGYVKEDKSEIIGKHQPKERTALQDYMKTSSMKDPNQIPPNPKSKYPEICIGGTKEISVSNLQFKLGSNGHDLFNRSRTHNDVSKSDDQIHKTDQLYKTVTSETNNEIKEPTTVTLNPQSQQSVHLIQNKYCMTTQQDITTEQEDNKRDTEPTNHKNIYNTVNGKNQKAILLANQQDMSEEKKDNERDTEPTNQESIYNTVNGKNQKAILLVNKAYCQTNQQDVSEEKKDNERDTEPTNQESIYNTVNGKNQKSTPLISRQYCQTNPQDMSIEKKDNEKHAILEICEENSAEATDTSVERHFTAQNVSTLKVVSKDVKRKISTEDKTTSCQHKMIYKNTRCNIIHVRNKQAKKTRYSSLDHIHRRRGYLSKVKRTIKRLKDRDVTSPICNPPTTKSDIRYINNHITEKIKTSYRCTRNTNLKTRKKIKQDRQKRKSRKKRCTRFRCLKQPPFPRRIEEKRIKKNVDVHFLFHARKSQRKSLPKTYKATNVQPKVTKTYKATNVQPKVRSGTVLSSIGSTKNLLFFLSVFLAILNITFAASNIGKKNDQKSTTESTNGYTICIQIDFDEVYFCVGNFAFALWTLDIHTLLQQFSYSIYKVTLVQYESLAIFFVINVIIFCILTRLKKTAYAVSIYHRDDLVHQSFMAGEIKTKDLLHLISMKKNHTLPTEYYMKTASVPFLYPSATMLFISKKERSRTILINIVEVA